jgi:biotin synthase
MGMEVCTTLGMLDAQQAKQLKEAGLTAYNHVRAFALSKLSTVSYASQNLDTSREYYPKVLSIRITLLLELVLRQHRSSRRAPTMND